MDPNPYASPLATEEFARGGRSDSADRAALAAVVRSHLADELSAFEIDEALDEFIDSTDETVRYVAYQVWHFFDDFEDHQVVLSRPAWNYLQRLLLLLESGRCVEENRVWHWSWTQGVAAVCLAWFAWCVWSFGWGVHLVLCTAPLGAISILISKVRRGVVTPGPYDAVLWPFASFAELWETRRQTPQFQKSRYRRELGRRRIRSPLANARMLLQHYAGWLLYSPVALAFQLAPVSEERVRVKRT